MRPAKPRHFHFSLSSLPFSLAALLLAALSACGADAPAPGQPAAKSAPAGKPATARREAAVAGKFYPGDAKQLRAEVDQFLSEAKPQEFKGRLFALIAPHAGYEFSGRVAAFSFKQIGATKFQRVIVLGPSHYGGFPGFSIMDAGAFATPLGDVPLDLEACAKLRANGFHVRADRAQLPEHSIEVELPFLQATAGEFKLVPILVGSVIGGDAEKIAAALREFLTPETLVVVSSDFTHYGPNYDHLPFSTDVEQNLKKLDMGAVDLILKKDFAGYARYMQDPSPTICGRCPIAILLRLLPAEAQGALLKYDTSGRVVGDFTNSVSYVSMMFTVQKDWKAAPAAKPADARSVPVRAYAAPDGATTNALTAEEQGILLKIARDTVEAFVRSGRAPEIAAPNYALTPALKAEAGAFVTLNEKRELRGCIGRIGYAEKPGDKLPPLYETVARMAVAACSQDPRFEPVRAEELKDITLEISVLSPARPVSGPEAFEVGRDGIIIRKGAGGAVFLPQVAPEQGWNREQTLANLCLKAGWPGDEWKKPGMTFLTFTAQVFGESK